MNPVRFLRSSRRTSQHSSHLNFHRLFQVSNQRFTLLFSRLQSLQHDPVISLLFNHLRFLLSNQLFDHLPSHHKTLLCSHLYNLVDCQLHSPVLNQHNVPLRNPQISRKDILRPNQPVSQAITRLPTLQCNPQNSRLCYLLFNLLSSH